MSEDERQQQDAAAAEDAAAAAADGPRGDGEELLDGKRKAKKVLSEKKLQRMKEAHERRGILYVSRIPPHMKPQKLRHLLSQYGEIGRVYCTPEDRAARSNRKKKGGNTGEPCSHRLRHKVQGLHARARRCQAGCPAPARIRARPAISAATISAPLWRRGAAC